MSSSRAVALAVVEAVESGSHADVALARALAAARLTGGPAARATALAYGTVRLRGRCDYVLGPLLSRPLDRLEPRLRSVLRLGAFELLWADKVTVPAAVHELVDLAGGPRRARAGYANAVLRRLADQADSQRTPPAELDSPARLTDRLVHWESHPRWLVDRWRRRFGAETCRHLCEAGNREPALHLRVNRLRTDRETLLARLREAGCQAEPGPLSPVAIRLAGGAPEALPGWTEGWFTIQDECAMLVAPVGEPAAGGRVLDLCAAPGGKATHLAELMANTGSVLAVDRDPERLARVDQAAGRLGLSCVTTRAGDAAGLVGEVEPAELVLLDAPCTGTGTLARRPDLRWRLTGARLREAVARQRDLLRVAAELTRPGGVMVYATCSLETEENEQQMEWFDQQWPAFAPDPEVAGPPPGWDRDAASALFLAGDGHDGFFVARRRRTR